ncbi:hypothetical protein LX32DRAFT_491721, partial [Colletotrichum zoysiae]
MSGSSVPNKETVALANKYYDDWQEKHPGAKFPAQITFTRSDPIWSALQKYPFYQTVLWTFRETGKTVTSI